MKPSISRKYKICCVLILLFFQFFQMLGLPLVQAQQGIFVPGDVRGRDSRDNQDPTSADDTRSDRGDSNDLQKRPPSSNSVFNPKDILTSGGLLYQVHVVGEVYNPGTYRIPASTRLSEVLQLAGGIRKNGSERMIQLKHSRKTGEQIDLVAYKLMGNLEQNPYVVDNDVILVPIKGRTVEIQGAVNRPRIYELTSEKTVRDLVRLGGGFSQGAALDQPLKIIRYHHREQKQVLDVMKDEMAQSAVLDGDILYVPHLFTVKNEFDYNVKKLPKDNISYPSYETRVFVLGAVPFPGAYHFNPYYHVSQYVSLAGGTTRLSKKNKVHLIKVTGEKKTLRMADSSDSIINPGDTIYVPEKAMSPESWASFFTSVAGLALGVTTSVISLTR